jgi:dipeptidyl aminopeptidase/acylaminoacyl peptidase
MNKPVLLFAAATVALLGCGGAQSTSSNQTKSEAEAVGKPSDALIPRAVLFGNPDKAGVQISPDGSKLSFLAAVDGVLNVWVAPIDDLGQAKPVTSDKTRPVHQYQWAYTSQHILYMQDTGGDENWHVFSVDLATGKTVDLTPFEKVQARLQGLSHRLPYQVLIGINNRVPQLHDVYRFDLRTGDKTLVVENPGFLGFVFDDDLAARLAIKPTPDGGQTIVKAGAEPGKWDEFMAIGPADALTTSPLTFDKSGANLYMWDSRDRNTSALMQVNVASGESKLIAEHARADGSGIHMHPTEGNVLAVSFAYARREWKILDESIRPDIEALGKISDGEAGVSSTSLDNRKWVVTYLDDDGPVRYYLWDRDSQKERFLFVHRKALEGVALAKMHPVMIPSRDGLELVSYLTLPVASDPDGDGTPDQPQPLVLLVHGGPWARDSWGYNPIHQLLANRGYAVLAVNFRGSTGFGKKFLNAANFEWGGKMQDDLLDAVDWAVKGRIADKVCIAGGSYGGYAALVGLTRDPERFACGVDIVGPSSILTLISSVPEYWKPILNIFRSRIGNWDDPAGKQMLEDRSPINHVDKIVRPLLIGQGANDPRVKQAESDRIVKAMQERKIPVSYVLYPDEGHGFGKPENSQTFFAAMEAFLSAHLGGYYEPITAEEISASSITVPEGVLGIPGFNAALAK